MESKKKVSKNSKTFPKSYISRKIEIQIIDFFIAILNFGVIIIAITFLNSSNLFLYFLQLGLCLILFGSMVFTFNEKNPYYIYFCYSIFICGIFYAFPLMIFNYSYNRVLFAISLLFFIPEIIYFYFLAKGFSDISRSMGAYKTHLYQNIGAGIDFDANRLNEYFKEHNLQLKIKEEEKEKELKKKFKANWIIMISLICTIGFFIAGIASVML